jgi:hypothetical protein
LKNLFTKKGWWNGSRCKALVETPVPHTQKSKNFKLLDLTSVLKPQHQYCTLLFYEPIHFFLFLPSSLPPSLPPSLPSFPPSFFQFLFPFFFCFSSSSSSLPLPLLLLLLMGAFMVLQITFCFLEHYNKKKSS